MSSLPPDFADQAINRMQSRFPGWQPEDGVCEPCLARFRTPEAVSP
jgi:hypothetical protein